MKEFEIEIEGTFTKCIKIPANNFKEAKLRAVEKFMDDHTEDNLDYRIAMVTFSETK